MSRHSSPDISMAEHGSELNNTRDNQAETKMILKISPEVNMSTDGKSELNMTRDSQPAWNITRHNPPGLYYD
jgi:hypothetical protein